MKPEKRVQNAKVLSNEFFSPTDTTTTQRHPNPENDYTSMPKDPSDIIVEYFVILDRVGNG